MADIFSTGPSRSGYMSGASNGFLAPRISDSTIGDRLAQSLGRDLGELGGAAFTPKKKPSALDQFRLQKEMGQKDAEEQIAALAQNATLDDIQAKYTDAMVVAARAGLGLDLVDQLFSGVALARGAGDMQVGRIGGKRGSYGPETFFTPDAASGRRTELRDNTLADQAAQIDEQQRREAVQQRGREYEAGAQRGLEDIRQRGRVSIEQLRDSLARDRDAEKAARDRKPGVTLQGVDDLRKNVTAALADRMGQLPTKEGDLDPENAVDPGVMGDIMTRASELMDAPNNMSAMDAINKAIEEKATIGGAQDNYGGTDLGLMGIWGGKDIKGSVKKKGADPLGIR